MIVATALILTANMPMGLTQSSPVGQMSSRLQSAPITSDSKRQQHVAINLGITSDRAGKISA